MQYDHRQQTFITDHSLTSTTMHEGQLLEYSSAHGGGGDPLSVIVHVDLCRAQLLKFWSKVIMLKYSSTSSVSNDFTT